MNTALVIATWNGLDRLKANLPTWRHQSQPFFRWIVVDNGSADGTSAYLSAQAEIRLIAHADNRGFAAGVNAGIREALRDPAVEALALVNDDVALDPDWHAEASCALAGSPRHGACATCLLQAGDPGRIDSAGIVWQRPWRADNWRHGERAPGADERPRTIAGASAGAALYRRVFLEDVGLFDETLFAYQEDVDLALRGARRGWTCVFAPAARGLHQGHASNRRFPLGGSRADFYNARNRLLVLIRSLPAEAWRRDGLRIAAAQFAAAGRSLRERRAAAVWCGLCCALARAPGAWRARRRLPDADRRTTGCRPRGGEGWQRFAVVIIARDVEAVLPAALASVPVEAECIVADGGSRDGTCAVACAHGARVVLQDLDGVQQACGNFDVARNAAGASASREWILFLDADERISKELTAELEAWSPDTDLAGADMPRINLYWGKPVRILGDDRQLRLARRGAGRFTGTALHRAMQVDGRVAHLTGALIHENIRSWSDVRRRFARDWPIAARQVAGRPTWPAIVGCAWRHFGYYWLRMDAWRDGWRGAVVALIYAVYHAGILLTARRGANA